MPGYTTRDRQSPQSAGSREESSGLSEPMPPVRRQTRVGSRSVQNLTKEQLERKRANDRDSQRNIRMKTKLKQEQLERDNHALKVAWSRESKLLQALILEMQKQILLLTRGELGVQLPLAAMANLSMDEAAGVSRRPPPAILAQNWSSLSSDQIVSSPQPTPAAAAQRMQRHLAQEPGNLVDPRLAPAPPKSNSQTSQSRFPSCLESNAPVSTVVNGQHVTYPNRHEFNCFFLHRLAQWNQVNSHSPVHTMSNSNTTANASNTAPNNNGSVIYADQPAPQYAAVPSPVNVRRPSASMSPTAVQHMAMRCQSNEAQQQMVMDSSLFQGQQPQLVYQPSFFQYGAALPGFDHLQHGMVRGTPMGMAQQGEVDMAGTVDAQYFQMGLDPRFTA